MTPYEPGGTLPEVIEHLRDVVRPLSVKMVAKQAARYPDLLTAEDREDLVEEVMARYLRKWDRGPGPDHLGAWLKPVVERTIVDDLRRRGARPKLAAPPEEADDLPFETMLASLLTPSLQTHYTKLLRDALSQVGREHPGDPELLEMRYAQGLDLTEVAERLGVNEDTAKKRVQRATVRVREAVTALAGTDGL